MERNPLPACLSHLAQAHPQPIRHLQTENNRLQAENDRLRSEVEDLRISVIAFGGPAMVQYARLHGFPPGHLRPHHYDILARAGARMDDFVRGEDPQ